MATKKDNGGFIPKLAAGILIATVGIFAADYLDIFTIEEWKALIPTEQTQKAEGEMQVHFIDVGQGDCSLIESGDTAILIDTGEAENGEKICNYLEENDIDNIDCLILTHPHSDHMGAAAYVVENTDVEKIVMPKISEELTPTTKFYEKFLNAVSEKGLKLTAAEPGMEIDAGEGTLEIIAPVEDYDDLNNYSIVLIARHGESSFLFTGDIEKKAEKDIIESGYLESADVLSVAHHGSRGSSSQEFLDIVNPEYCVISCGEGNSYGHPYEEAVERLSSFTDEIYRTDIDGTIIFTSEDGNITIETENGE